jgi:uncharacterized protein YbjQ (UPF0145 family)
VDKFALSTIMVMCVCGVSAHCAQAQAQTGLVAQAGAGTQRTIPGYVTNKGEAEPATTAAPPPSNIAPAAVVTPTQRTGYVAGDFLATTTSVVEGYSILDYKGLVEGAAVRVPTWSEDAAAGSREVYGGSIDSYAQLCEEARIQAFNTMIDRAKKLGANAVIGIHFDSQVMPLDKGKFASGVVCVGTAVIIKHKAR